VVSAALRGCALGFAIAATPGPIFFLCFKRTLARGWRIGMASGMGVATADGFYAAVAALGVGAVTVAVTTAHRWIALVGGVLVVAVGIRSLVTVQRRDITGAATPRRLSRAYASTLALTLANPTTILAFAAVFAGLDVGARGTGDATALTVGVIAGSALWWVLLVAAVRALRLRITTRIARWIGGLSGAAIMVLGVLAIVAALPRT
jgi:threonine/homoserine/homoserine lactone efflux protein